MSPRLELEEHYLLVDVRHTLMSLVYDRKPAILLTAGFIESPINCRLQEWHYDFGGKTENIFIPLKAATFETPPNTLSGFNQGLR